MTTPPENKEIVRRYYEEAVGERKLDLLDELIAEDVVNHDPLSDETLSPAEARGFDGFCRHVETAYEGFPDLEITVDELLAEGDLVFIKFTFSGTHLGQFGGIEPTGNRISQSNMGLLRVEDGKITERWLESDDLEMLQQLGVLPAEAELAKGAA